MITENDLVAIREYAHNLAQKWWETNSEDTAICDVCNSRVSRGDGFIFGSSLYCEICAGNQFGPDGLARLRADPNFFGRGMVEKAREFVGQNSNLTNKITLSNGIELMRVSMGKFLMGSANSNKFAQDNECPQHTVDIPYDYWMARFHVTNELYIVYTEAKGIKYPVHIFGWEWQKYHPVTMVTWLDAMKYCQWLNNLLKRELPSDLVLRLPTEAEWEKAARWKSSASGSGQTIQKALIRMLGRVEGEALEYPWGDEFNKDKCNTGEGCKNNPTPVGVYSSAGGDSPYGCADMAGNVNDWVHSLMKDYPYKVNDGREDEKASGDRVYRGGAFCFNQKFARCAFRNYVSSDGFCNNIGFRVVLAPSLN